jgi:hypothetical protein
VHHSNASRSARRGTTMRIAAVAHVLTSRLFWCVGIAVASGSVLVGAPISSAHATALPPGAYHVLFETGPFVQPLVFDLEKTAIWRLSGPFNRFMTPDEIGRCMQLESVDPTCNNGYEQFQRVDPKLVSFMVSKQMVDVRCRYAVVDDAGRRAQACLMSANFPIDQLPIAGRRELATIDYQNSYMQGPTRVLAVTFKFRVHAVAGLHQTAWTFKGLGKAIRNPDTGEWQLESMEFPGFGGLPNLLAKKSLWTSVLTVYEAMLGPWPPFDPSKAMRR